jgi:hypothetical protein
LIATTVLKTAELQLPQSSRTAKGCVEESKRFVEERQNPTSIKTAAAAAATATNDRTKQLPAISPHLTSLQSSIEAKSKP